MTIFYKKRCSFLLLFLFSSSLLFAQTIKGKVVDSKTGEPMIGATVTLEHTKYNALVNLDGSYTFKNLPAGKYEIVVKSVGYKKLEHNYVTLAANETKTTNLTLESEVNELLFVTVTGGSRETDRAVRSIEQRADIVQNIMSQKAIELSPDVTVANSLQRMSGVTIQRSSSGEGRYAIIRGMDQRYNTTLINGIKIPSPDDKYRYVPMDLFPSDLLERLEVVKALTPNMEADAIGGVMNLVMKSAPKKEVFNVFLSTGSSTLFSNKFPFSFSGSRPFQTFDRSAVNKQSPAQINGAAYSANDADFSRKNLNLSNKAVPDNIQAGATYGNRFFKKRLGFILGVSYQNNYRGSDQILNTQYPGAKVLPTAVTGSIVNNYPQFNDAIDNKYSTQQSRIAVNNKFDFSINKNNNISLYNLFVHMDEFQTRYSSDTDVNTNPGNVALITRTRWQAQDIYNSTLHGEHKLSNRFNINWNATYSVAKQQIPDMATFEVDYAKTKNADGTMSLPLNFVALKGMSRQWSHNTDKDIAGYLNFVYDTRVKNTDLQLSWGGLYRHKIRDNYNIKYSLSATSNTFTSINDAQYAFNIASGNSPYGEGGTGRNYNIKEDIASGYGQFKWTLTPKLQAIGGVRVENTNQHYTTNLPADANAQFGHIYYVDILPSLHFKYAIDNEQNIRTSYFRSLVRPGFVEMIPQDIPASENDAYEQQGNPYLKHTTADNYDLRYELFPKGKGSDQILIGGFLKRIYNPIEVTFSHYSVIGGNPSPGTNILTPTNVGNVTNYGAEFVFTKFIGKFGINANYTYTHSATTTDKYYLSYDTVSKSNVTSSRSQTRPLQGQAKHIANVSFIFKNPKTGTDIQLAYVYTGERIALVNTFYNLDTWQSPYSQLDFSFEQKIVKKLAIYGKINNLLDFKTRYFIKQPYVIGNTLNKIPGQDDAAHSIFVQQDIYKISYLFGLRYKL